MATSRSNMYRPLLFTALLALTFGSVQVRADCAVDENGYRRCDGGLSWTARLWIYVAAGVFLIICTMIFGWWLRRRHNKRRRMLRAAPGAPTYAQGEFFEQRRASLGVNYAPPRHLAPVASRNAASNPAGLSMVESRQSVPGYFYPGGPVPRPYNRSDLPPPPEYEEAAAAASAERTAAPNASAAPVHVVSPPQVTSRSSQETLTNPEPAAPLPSHGAPTAAKETV